MKCFKSIITKEHIGGIFDLFEKRKSQVEIINPSKELKRAAQSRHEKL